LGWSANGDLYLPEQGKLIRISPDGGNRAIFLNQVAIEPVTCGSEASGARKPLPVVFINAEHSPFGIAERAVWRVDADGTNPRELSGHTGGAFGPRCSRMESGSITIQ